MSSTHEQHAHGGHETEDFKGIYAIWAVPFSLSLLFAFVFIVALWVPAAASKEMKLKDLAGAEVSHEVYREHDAEDAEEMGDIEEAMEAVVREREAR
jgi:hypothetical protein